MAGTLFVEEQINRQNSRKAAVSAFVQASKKIKSPTKNATNPFLKNRYADLGSVIDSVKDVLAEHGIVAVQESRPASVNNPNQCAIIVETRFMHESGEQAHMTSCVVYLKEISPQGTMGAFTYGRRYALLAAFNMAAEDDDANDASGKGFSDALKPEEKEKVTNQLKGLVKK